MEANKVHHCSSKTWNIQNLQVKTRQQEAAIEDLEDFYNYFCQYFDLEQVLCYDCFHYLFLIVNL